MTTELHISLLTGAVDPHYQLDLLSGLLSQRVTVDFIGSDAMKEASVLKRPGVNFLNFRGDQNPKAPAIRKILRVLRYYWRLVIYSGRANTQLFHIQWPNKFVHFDRVILNAYYKLLGKKIVLTAHNVNERERDGRDTVLNRLTLRIMYRIVDHIIVHTTRMKTELAVEYGSREDKITVIPHGINNVVPKSSITKDACRQFLRIEDNDKVLLFFGNIAPYKGLEYLILALDIWRRQGAEDFKLLIAGRVRADSQSYWKEVKNLIDSRNLGHYIIVRREFIPDHEIELFCKAADVMVLPYTKIFQSGILFIAYGFGLPVIATDVGSFDEDIVVGKTGFICRAQEPQDIAEKIAIYFRSELYKKLEKTREAIMGYANNKYSWEAIGKRTSDVYRALLKS